MRTHCRIADRIIFSEVRPPSQADFEAFLGFMAVSFIGPPPGTNAERLHLLFKTSLLFNFFFPPSSVTKLSRDCAKSRFVEES